ncbi:MAG: CrcB family protein [Psychrobacter sp.]|uniref:Fluoride-specific ion channel FluC n=1 Tax=Psychrobacter glacincola TaxID=56810 RepID=A0ABW1W3L7_9GAMM|nr:CrcB family protein [Psychrobacter glacincola]MBP6495036.1 CrcB family protein [Psychrobacter sp.]HAR76460.1 chromosome condensation protein CrcB [Psychrobacter sp.]|tara:strand:- start:5 stop:376 length:372 start_codon:yes stop_codon:yes gene_type:complete
MQWLAIGLGAAFGACLRGWMARFNPLHHWIPLGTLGANVLGGLLIGLALVWFERIGSGLSDNVRLFVITGFLGGLTTFSTFSAEVFTFIHHGRLLAALGLVGLHVGLTLVATALGFYFFKLIL